MCAILRTLAVRSTPKCPPATAVVARRRHLHMVLSVHFSAALLLVPLPALLAAFHMHGTHSPRVRTMIRAILVRTMFRAWTPTATGAVRPPRLLRAQIAQELPLLLSSLRMMTEHTGAMVCPLAGTPCAAAPPCRTALPPLYKCIRSRPLRTPFPARRLQRAQRIRLSSQRIRLRPTHATRAR